MADNITLEGNDLGVIAGAHIDLSPNGVFIYRPKNDLVPRLLASGEHLDSWHEDYRNCVEGVSSVCIDYYTVRQVEVDGRAVWRNKDCFPGIRPGDQVFWGRGNVSVEFRGDLEGIEPYVEKVLRRDAGLERKA